MSFLDNPKNAGIAVTIVGILEIILGIILVITGIIDEETDTVVGVVSGIGGFIVGFLYFGFGKKIYSGEISDKWSIACRFVLLTAVVQFVNGIFGYTGKWEDWVVSIVVGIIVALIIYWVYTRMVSGGDNAINKILWIILVLVLIISIIANIIELIAFPIGTIYGICGLIINLFLLVTLFDSDVRSHMGM